MSTDAFLDSTGFVGALATARAPRRRGWMPVKVLLLAATMASGLAAQETNEFDRLSLGELTELARDRLAADLQLPSLGVELPPGALDLRDVTVEFSFGANASFTATGSSTILGTVTTDVLVSVMRLGDGSPHLLIGLRPRSLGLGDLFPGTTAGGAGFSSVVLTTIPSLGSGLEQTLSVPARALSETARAFYRQVLGPGEFTLELDDGIGLLGAWPLSQLPELVLRTLGMDPGAEVLLEGSLGMSLRTLAGGGAAEAGMYLKGTLPVPGRPPEGFPEWLARVRLTELTLELARVPPAVLARVGTAFEADVDGQARSFVGSTVLSLGETPTDLLIVAALQDPWPRPFGVEWLTLEEVGVLLSLGTGGSRGEFHGAFELAGSRGRLDMAVASSAGRPVASFEAEVDRLAARALTDLLRTQSRNASLALDLPSGMAELRDVQMSFASGAEASFAFSGTGLLDVELDGQTRRFEVTTDLALEGGAVDAILEGRLDGVWDRPFGVEWLRLDDVRLELGAAAGDDPLVGGTLISSFALGTNRVGLEIALEKAPAGTTARFTGSIDRLSIADLAELVQRHLGETPFEGRGPDLVLRNFRMSLEAGARRSFSLSATTDLDGRKADLLLSTAMLGGRRQIITGLKLDDWSLSDAIPAFEGSVVEELRFSTVALLLTRASGRIGSEDLGPEAQKFYRAVQGRDDFTLKLEPGLSLVAAMPLAGPLATPLETLGSQADQVLVAGALPGSVLGLGGGGGVSLRAELPPMAPTLPNGRRPPWFRSGQLAFFIEAGPGGAAAGLDGTLDVTIDETDMSFIVAGEFGSRPVAISLRGALATDEPWVSPFDIGWLTLRGVAVELAFDPITVALGLGFSGDLDIGKKNLEVDVALALNLATGVPTNFVFRGASSTAFGVSDLVDFQQRMAQAAGREGRIPTDRIPELDLRPIDLETPVEVKFALRPYEEVTPGFAMSGALFGALSQTAPPEMIAEVECRIGLTGIKMYGSVPRDLEVGGLTLQSPLVDLDMVTLPPAASFVLSGDVEMPWFTKRLDIELDSKSRVPRAIARVRDTKATFEAFAQAFKADPVDATERSLTGDRGLFTVAGVPPPPWMDELFAAIGAVREVRQGTDSRTLLASALNGIDVTIPAGEGLPRGGLAASGCRATQTLESGRCWRVPPSEAEELGFTTTCVSGLLESGRCWLVRPSQTSTRAKVTRRECVTRNRRGICTRWGQVQECPLRTTESGGRCYLRPPGPPRLSAPAEPSTLCAGIVRDGKCWKPGRAPSPEGGAEPGCPIRAPIYLDSRCWRVPPTPEIQTKTLGGVCKTADVSCTVDGLLDETISPLIEQAVSELLAPFESTRSKKRLGRGL